MDILLELLIYGFFYLTGFVLTYVLSLGALKPEVVNWMIRKDWEFGTFIHIVDGKRYLDWEWVVIIGVLFWVSVALVSYYVWA